MTLVPASDGLPARLVHEWSDEKLFYVERYMDIFTGGMKNKWPRLAYADFFAGPGMCVERKTRQESPGSPLRAIAHDGFHGIFLNDKDPEAVAALQQRVAPTGDRRIRIAQQDCNDAVEEAVEFLFPRDIRRSTLGLAFIDPTAFQMTYEAIGQLAEGRPIDLIITFMTGYVKRFRESESLARNVDSFVGTDEWRGHRSFGGVLEVYKNQLRKLGYRHVVDDSRILNSKNSTIYHLVFASKDERGEDFFRKISQRTYSGQRKFPF